MKIIAVGRNYSEHSRELNNPLPSSPVIFLKPDTAVLRQNMPFYLPDFSNDIHHEIEVIIKINREGKHIAEKFAHKYWDEVSVGIDFTARDLQTELKGKGLPWELSKAFDGSAALGKFIPCPENLQESGEFSLKVNGESRQQGHCRDMIFKINYLISYISAYFTLRKGDIIFTGTPAGVGKVNAGDQLVGFLNGQELLNLNIR